MQSFTLLVLILMNFVINIQSIPLTQSSDATQSRSVRNPEENRGFDGGDMVLPPVSLERGVVIRPAADNRWTGGVIPYKFAANISADNLNFIVKQMRAMEDLTKVNNTKCIKFRRKNATDLYYITIFNGSGCYAPVGSWGSFTGVRPVSLLYSPTATCMVSGIVQHELTHVLGFYHEQSRPDRDSYVSINWANIDPTQQFNFDKYNDTEVDTQMTSYDYGSVMHYDRYAFAINYSIATITPTQDPSAVIGQRIQLSPTDILEIQRYYGCVPTPDNATMLTTTPSTSTSTTITTTSSSVTSSIVLDSTTSSIVSDSTTSSTISTTSSRVISTSTMTAIPTSSITTTTQTKTTTSIGVRDTIPWHFGIHLVCLTLISYFSNKVH